MLHHGCVNPKKNRKQVKDQAKFTIEENPFGQLFPGEGVKIGQDELNDLQLLLTDRNAPQDDSAFNPAGFTFFGQFIDHDVTLAELEEGEEDLTKFMSIKKFVNLRSPDLDLDSVFGQGPESSKDLYNADWTLKTGADTGGFAFDLPRNGDEAIIGDPRNDENKIIAQIHASFLHAYNRMLKEAGGDKTDYTVARQRLYTTYQYILLNDYLKRFVDPKIFDEVLKDRAKRFKAMVDANGGKAVMPMEFAVAAFRFGHSQVRAGYRMNDDPDSGVRIFSDDDENDLNGGMRIDPVLRFDHTRFFSDETPLPGKVSRGRKIDSKLALPLFSLEAPSIPDNAIGSRPNPRSLGHRNLLRSRQVQLLSGFEVAKQLGVQALKDKELELFSPTFSELRQHPPLWYYILKEAEVFGQGERLGPVGSYILCETFIGLLENTQSSYFRLEGRDWTPPGELTSMARLLAYADVPAN
jgi:hypothetical protein